MGKKRRLIKFPQKFLTKFGAHPRMKKFTEASEIVDQKLPISIDKEEKLEVRLEGAPGRPGEPKTKRKLSAKKATTTRSKKAKKTSKRRTKKKD